MKVCSCCGHIWEDGRICPRCGFFHQTQVGELNKDQLSEREKDIEEYRINLLENITNLSLKVYSYCWNEDSVKYVQSSDPMYRIISESGKDIFGENIVWTKQEFGQFFTGNDNKSTIELGYIFDGANKQLKCEITPVECDDFWHVGLRITDQLELIVFLGREDNYAESEPMELDLK